MLIKYLLNANLTIVFGKNVRSFKKMNKAELFWSWIVRLLISWPVLLENYIRSMLLQAVQQRILPAYQCLFSKGLDCLDSNEDTKVDT
jgi:hypothetical protein